LRKFVYQFCDPRSPVRSQTPAGCIAVKYASANGVFTEFEGAIIQEGLRAGLARAREKGTKSRKPIGRGKINPLKEAAIRKALANGKGILKTARECQAGTSVVQRIKGEMARANEADALR